MSILPNNEDRAYSRGWAAGHAAALASLPAAAPPAGADRLALKLLVAAGFVTQDKANEALQIAHGFARGPLTPQPAKA